MTPITWNDSKEGSKYARQLRLTFKRFTAGRCIQCKNDSPVLELRPDGTRPIRCERHLAYQRGRGKKLLNGKSEEK